VAMVKCRPDLNTTREEPDLRATLETIWSPTKRSIATLSTGDDFWSRVMSGSALMISSERSPMATRFAQHSPVRVERAGLAIRATNGRRAPSRPLNPRRQSLSAERSERADRPIPRGWRHERKSCLVLWLASRTGVGCGDSAQVSPPMSNS
jgi:hypothetical protein